MFKSEQEREAYYLENINKNYGSISNPEVVWTHDFTNIPHYRKHFKNAKILVITNKTPNEQLTALFMLATKVKLDKNCLVPITPDLWAIFMEDWANKCTSMLTSFMSLEAAHKIMADRYNHVHKDTLLYATITGFLKARQMLHIVEDVPEQDVLLNYTSRPFNLKIEKNLDSYIDSECTVLPYAYLADNNDNLLIETLSNVLGRDLKEEEIDYVRSSFNKYRSAQNEIILTNPVAYYKELRHRVLNKKYDENGIGLLHS